MANIHEITEYASVYNDNFYANQKDGSKASAHKVIPFINALFPEVKSVVDFGCGTGAWLKKFQDLGKKVQGLDFGIGVPAHLMISESAYQSIDLGSAIRFPEKFDLCMSLEVGEHIENRFSDAFIENLVNAADIILFSAAIPGQPGTLHINPQWPAWWARRFAKAGYEAFDILRPYFWLDEDINWWYRQNMMLYIHQRQAALFPKLHKFDSFRCLPLIHPEMR